MNHSKTWSPERVGQQLGALHLVDGVVQARGQRLDPLLGQLLGCQGEQVVVGLGRQRVVLGDAAQPGREDHREGEVRVAGAVGGPVLQSGRLGLAHLDHGHPHQRRAVVAGPAHVDGRLVSADEALVGVDPLVGHRGDLAGVVQQAGDEAARHLGEPVAVVLVDERVALALPQRDVGVHARALHARRAAWA